MKKSDKKLMIQLMLNEMKDASYTKKEGIYANLIINVLEEANKFGESLDNVYVDHNIIEAILIYGSLSTHLHDTFGRSEEEFSIEFIAACNKLKEQFDLDYPYAESYKNGRILYITPKFFGVRTFMRKVISKIVFPLVIETKVQPIFVSLKMFRDGMLNLSWYKGKKQGYYFMQEDYMISKNLNKSEMILLENLIDERLRLKGYELLEVEELSNIIDAFTAKAA